MLRFLFDTDHLTLFEQGHAPLGTRLAKQPAGAVGVSVVTVEESLRGRLAHLARAKTGPDRIHRYGWLAASVRLFQQFPVVPFDQTAETRFQSLRSLRVGAQDLKIAAVALTHYLILLTRNQRDFGQVPGLVLDDWST
jgi:tRNA(fMet)-specific endonuclease VapC